MSFVRSRGKSFGENVASTYSVYLGERGDLAKENGLKNIFDRDAWFRWRYNIRLEAAMAEHWLKKGDLDKAREFVERLYATATEHEVHKYIAVAHHLRARVCLAANDLTEAEKNFDAALAELEKYPVPLVEWKVQAGKARLKTQLGQESEAQEASTRAMEIVNFIASNVNDETLRNTFLNASKQRI